MTLFKKNINWTLVNSKPSYPSVILVMLGQTTLTLFFFFFNVWIIFKVFIDFVTISLLFYLLIFLARSHVVS